MADVYEISLDGFVGIICWWCGAWVLVFLPSFVSIGRIASFYCHTYTLYLTGIRSHSARQSPQSNPLIASLYYATPLSTFDVDTPSIWVQCFLVD
jgi:hypothetical protein